MNTDFRRQILQILAQQATPITQSTAPNVTTGPTTVTGVPTTFDPYSYYPTMMIGWGANNVQLIRQLSNALNWAFYIISNGQFDMNKLRVTNFILDISKFPDRILIILAKFAVLVYRLIYTNRGAPFKTAIGNRTQLIQMLRNALTTLPDGTLNAFLSTKIGGGLKIVLLNILSQIK